MLEEGNAAMVDLARDYKRQQAMIEKYRLEDNSLQSFSQLTQSQPTKQQQQQQQQQQLQQQLQGQQQQQETQHQQQQEPQHQHQQLHLLKPPPATPLLACREDDGAVGDRAVGDEAVGDGGADGAADAKSSLEGLLECSQGSATFVSRGRAWVVFVLGWVFVGLGLGYVGLGWVGLVGSGMCNTADFRADVPVLHTEKRPNEKKPLARTRNRKIKATHGVNC